MVENVKQLNKMEYTEWEDRGEHIFLNDTPDETSTEEEER